MSVKEISQENLTQYGKNNFYRNFRRESGRTVSEVKSNGFYRRKNALDEWRHQDVTLLQNIYTGEYFAEINRRSKRQLGKVLSLCEHRKIKS